MAVVHNVLHEVRVLPVGGLVLQVDDLAGLAPAEDGHDQVQLAVAVEVSGLHVRHAPTPSSSVMGVKVPSALPRSQMTRAQLGIGRRGAAEVGDDQVLDAVAIEVHHLGMSRDRQLGQHAPGRIGLVRPQHADLARGRMSQLSTSNRFGSKR